MQKATCLTNNRGTNRHWNNTKRPCGFWLEVTIVGRFIYESLHKILAGTFSTGHKLRGPLRRGDCYKRFGRIRFEIYALSNLVTLFTFFWIVFIVNNFLGNSFITDFPITSAHYTNILVNLWTFLPKMTTLFSNVFNYRVSILRLSPLLPSNKCKFKTCLQIIPLPPPRPVWLFQYKRNPSFK